MSAAQQVPDILSSEFAANPCPAYAAMREREPLIWHEATQSYIISRYEDVELVFKDRKSQLTTESYDWQLEPVHGRTILQLSGREHAVRRALVTPAFRGTELQGGGQRRGLRTALAAGVSAPSGPGSADVPRGPGRRRARG